MLAQVYPRICEEIRAGIYTFRSGPRPDARGISVMGSKQTECGLYGRNPGALEFTWYGQKSSHFGGKVNSARTFTHYSTDCRQYWGWP